MEIRNIPSGIAAVCLDLSKDMFRKLCNDHELGKRIGTEIHLSDGEYRQFALANALATAGLGWSAAFAMVRNPTPQIALALTGQGDPLTFWPKRGNSEEGAHALSCAVKIIVDAGTIVRASIMRLDAEREVGRAHGAGRRRLSFEPVPGRAHGS